MPPVFKRALEAPARIAIGNVTRAMVAATLRDITRDTARYPPTGRAAVSAIYAWAIGEGLCEANPVIGTNKAGDEIAARPRADRCRTGGDLEAAPDNDYGRIVRLLMLTGQRRDEIGSLHGQKSSPEIQERR